MNPRSTSVSLVIPISEPRPEFAPCSKPRKPRLEGRFPRQGEPIFPRVLVPLLQAAGTSATLVAGRDLRSLRADAWNDLTRDERHYLAMIVVETVQDALRDAPRTFLERALPKPEAVLDRLPLERRTANLLRKWIATEPTDGPWTLSRYLSIPRFGARGLVDLLAALEGDGKSDLKGALRAAAPPTHDQGGPLLTSPPRAALVARAMQIINPRLPLSERDANAALRSNGVVSKPVALADLARTAARLKYEPPFHAIEIGGTRIAVKRPDITAARTAYAVAARAVYNWGAATVAGVADQLGVMAAFARSSAFVERVLTAVTTFEWLERDGGWFWFRGQANRMVADIVKVLAVVPHVSAGRLWEALCRARAAPEQPPASILGRICDALPGVYIQDGVIVTRQAPAAETRLTYAERRLLAILKRSGGPLTAPEVRARGVATGLSWKTLWRLLVASPLVEHVPLDRYTLIGST